MAKMQKKDDLSTLDERTPAHPEHLSALAFEMGRCVIASLRKNRPATQSCTAVRTGTSRDEVRLCRLVRVPGHYRRSHSAFSRSPCLWKVARHRGHEHAKPVHGASARARAPHADRRRRERQSDVRARLAFDTLRGHATHIAGSLLYEMRVDARGSFFEVPSEGNAAPHDHAALAPKSLRRGEPPAPARRGRRQAIGNEDRICSASKRLHPRGRRLEGARLRACGNSGALGQAGVDQASARKRRRQRSTMGEGFCRRIRKTPASGVRAS